MGNFHITGGEARHSAEGVHRHMNVPIFGLEFTHRVNRLSFGKDFPGVATPLDGQSMTLPQGIHCVGKRITLALFFELLHARSCLLPMSDIPGGIVGFSLGASMLEIPHSPCGGAVPFFSALIESARARAWVGAQPAPHVSSPLPQQPQA